ncbi:MAG: gamma-glutamyl-gamma-aminobutyrate hydrolase family protein [Acidobacteriaceae bacterium]
MNRPRIAIPEPSSLAPDYSARNWPLYAAAVESAGGEPVLIPLSASQTEIAATIASCKAVLLPGSGADVNPARYGEQLNGSNAADPAREAADELLLQDAFNLHKPLLGICYGFQSMNVWLGGSLIQDLPTQKPSQVAHGRIHGQLPPPHPIDLLEGSHLHALAGASLASVNSSHHQSIARLGDRLQPVATCPVDGVIEAAEMPGSSFTIGVQWHPERTYQHDAFSQRIFNALVEAARAWQPLPNTVSNR